MATSPKVEFPAQTDTTDPAGYPEGAARNASFQGAGDGTPLERRWLNDLFGMWQALLALVGVTPSGTPDKVGASQYLDAIRTIAHAGGDVSGFDPASEESQFSAFTTTSFVTPNSGGTVSIPNCAVGDVMRISAHTTADLDNATGYGVLQLLMTEDQGGGGEVSKRVPGCLTAIRETDRRHVSWHTLVQVSVAGTFQLELQGKVTDLANVLRTKGGTVVCLERIVKPITFASAI